MPDFILELLSYEPTGGLKLLETGLILALVAFLVWNIMLFLETDDEDGAL